MELSNSFLGHDSGLRKGKCRINQVKTEEQNNQLPKVDEVSIWRPTSQFLSVLRLRRFMIFSISQAISLFGDKLDYMALLAMIAYFGKVYQWEQARALSYLSVIITLPTIIFGPVAGILIDRWNRAKVMITCDTARALLVIAIPLLILKTGNLIFVYTIAFLVFLFGLFFNTCRLSVIPNLVSPRRLLAANSFINFIGRVSTFFGMFLGGIIVDWQIWRKIGIQQSFTAGFYLDSLTYWISVIALIIIYPHLAKGQTRLEFSSIQNPKNNTTTDGLPLSLFQDLKQAYLVIRKIPQVLFVYASILILVVLGAAVFVLFIPIIQSVPAQLGFGLGTKGVGFVGAIGSIGLVLSSMTYGVIGHRIKKRDVILGGFLILGIIAILLALFKTFVPVIPLAFLAGFLLSPIFIAQDTLLHEYVPPAARGRIFSTREWLLHLSFAVSAFLIGQLTLFFQKRLLFLIIGIFIVLLSIFGFFATRQRQIG
uniref:MFS transporter n=1 Tax=candidate division WOR-3 bacterium TaxID=2052148 RepID=A0A7C6A9C7_UNCW3